MGTVFFPVFFSSIMVIVGSSYFLKPDGVIIFSTHIGCGDFIRLNIAQKHKWKTQVVMKYLFA